MRRWVAVALVGVVLAGCGGGSDDATRSHTTAVGRVELTLVDAARPTPADPHRHLAEQASRTLPTVVLYPEDSGRHPLVVFAHGHSRDAHEYEGLLKAWVEHGYVVAAPNFPLSTGPEATPDDTMSYADVANQPGDLRFVIHQLPKRKELRGRIDTDHVAVVGHSLGAITALLLRDDPGPDVDAIVSVAGMPLGTPPKAATGLPLLLVHSAKDPTVPVAGSDQVFAGAAPPLAFLRFTTGGHDEIFDGGGPAQTLTHKAILAFLDARLRGRPAAWRDFPGAVEPPLATFRSRP